MNPIETEAKIRAMEVMLYEDKGASVRCAPAPCSEASFDVGVWFQAACSGLWYQKASACGEVAAVRIDGKLFKPLNDAGQRAPT